MPRASPSPSVLHSCRMTPALLPCHPHSCRFGATCKFDHPPEFAVALSRAGLPLRPGQPPCSFFQRTGACKFGPSCKFDHS